MKINIYKSVLKDRIYDFINFKQAQGYKYISEISGIKSFDKFLLTENYKQQIISREIVDMYTVLCWSSGNHNFTYLK